jgi:hypothetical protein
VALTKISAGVIAANAVVDSFGTQSITGDKIGLTAINANNIVNSSITGDKIGAGQITANLFAAGAVSATSIFNGTSNVSILSSDGAVSIGTNGTEALRVDTSRNIGIGTASPTARLDVRRSTTEGAIAEFHQSSGYGIDISSSEAIANISSGYLQSFAFKTDNGSGQVEQARITSAGLLQFNSGYGSVATAFGCRAWVNFDGTGTPAIRASGNVSSITDNGTGNYTVNFTTSMPDTNYAVVCSSNTPNWTYNIGVSTYATGSITLVTNTASDATDFAFINSTVFR